MNEFQYRVAISRLSDFNTVLTDEELETYCEYTMDQVEEVNDSFSIIDRLLQQRLVSDIPQSVDVSDFIEYCMRSWTSGNYG